MSDDERDNGHGPDPAGRPADPIEALLRASGRRPPVPAGRSARVRATVHAAWQEQVGARTRRRWRRTTALAAAASVMLAALIAGLWWRPGAGTAPPVRTLGQIEMVVGSARSTAGPAEPDLPGVPAGAGQSLVADQTLVTGVNGRLALRLVSGHSVRLDAGTRVRLLSDRSLALEAGALYADSRDASGRPASAPVEIHTPQAVLHEMGTQFEVRLLEGTGAVRVRVREGAVLRAPGSGSPGDPGPLEVRAGQELTLVAGEPHRLRDLAPHGEAWAWLAAVTPMPDIEGRSLLAFLQWAARERGLELAFQPESLAGTAAATDLKGSIQGMSPDEALASVLATTGLEYRIQEGTLSILP